MALYLVPTFDKKCPIAGLDTNEKISEYIVSHPEEAANHAKVLVCISDEAYKYRDKKIHKVEQPDGLTPKAAYRAARNFNKLLTKSISPAYFYTYVYPCIPTDQDHETQPDSDCASEGISEFDLYIVSELRKSLDSLEPYDLVETSSTLPHIRIFDLNP